MDKFKPLINELELDKDILQEILDKDICFKSKDKYTIFKTLLEVINLILNNSYNLSIKLHYLLNKYCCYAEWNSVPFCDNDIKIVDGDLLENKIQYQMLDNELLYLLNTGGITYVQYLNIRDKIESGEINLDNNVYYIDNIPYACGIGISKIDHIIRNRIREENSLLQDLFDYFDYDVICNNRLIDNTIISEQ